jgi:glycosyltransferase involved in cell wall biosynthesis
MRRKVLLSAYACEPGKGSEPGIGWNWASQLEARGAEVWVLTQPRFVPVIEAACRAGGPRALKAIGVGVPLFDRFEGALSRLGTPYYYAHILAWQLAAFRTARALHREQGFDWVHHVTLGAARIPSFMGRLGIPFIWGPVAGGETAPWRLRRSYPLRGWGHALVRDLSNLWVRIDPLLRLTARQAVRIIATSEQTRALLPPAHREKSQLQLAIGIETPGMPEASHTPRPAGLFRVLFVGRLLYWKGLHLGLRAFAGFLRDHPEARMTVIGDGPDRAWLMQLSERLGIRHAVEWIGWMEREDVGRAYGAHDAFLFPSLHDSGGMVVLEALSRGLPVICLDLGGPGLMVDASCGRVVATPGADEHRVVAALHAALSELALSPDLRERLCHGALARVREYAWSAVVERAYSAIPAPVAAGPAARRASWS